jgi:hypothetical protein
MRNKSGRPVRLERGFLTQIGKKRPAPSADIVDTASDEPFAPRRLAA